jgi:hypothetical protein
VEGSCEHDTEPSVQVAASEEGLSSRKLVNTCCCVA